MKSQVLVDFIAKFAVSKQQEQERQTPTKTWSLYVDGSLNEKGWGAGILLKNPNKKCIYHLIHFGFKASNKKEEYEALDVGLELAIKFKA